MGRPVFGPELEAAALQVEGVQFISELRLAFWDGDTAKWVEPSGPVALDLDEVIELAEITVVSGDDALAPGETGAPPETGLSPVPIPVPREEC
jgi:hypothetical protein